ncbi:MAG: AraC family transcriptional regulator [Planctomycetes bacterium]|nr:AraC family transcriptional regulator [Planctomycetota bacterium]
MNDPLANEPRARRLAGFHGERRRDLHPGGVLVALRTAFHCTLTAGRFGPSWSQRLVMAKWVLSGAASMEVDGQRLPFGPGQVAIYLPTIPHRFWADASVNRFCWFTVDGPFAEAFVLELGLRPGIYTIPPPSRQRIKAMTQSLADSSPAGRRQSSLMAMAEWYRLADAVRAPPPSDLVSRVRDLIAQEFADPELSAKDLARRLDCHRGTLSRRFHELTGQTLIAHLTEVRLREAQALLANTDETMAAVARQCGMRDAAYFCRWFRKLTSMTPGSARSAARG